LTEVMLKTIVPGVGSVSAPPPVVPPVSRTRKVKDATPLPFSSTGGVQVRLGTSTAAIAWSTVTATDPSFSAPFPGSDVMMISRRPWPSPSLYPKSDTAKRWTESSSSVAVDPAPSGASLRPYVSSAPAVR
jgi:hypothetical protein